ncbi:MAG: hypothetical protein Q4B31_00950 [Clostridia bacterium]|nr:hypothetical protein [Clostridia bacterium]
MDNFMGKVKDTLGKVVGGAEKYTKVAKQKTSDLITQTKHNFSINDLENKVVEVMVEIGGYIYAEHMEGAELPEELVEKCEQIDSYKDEINELKAKIAELKESKFCSECGEYNHDKNVYCAKCGSKLDD